MKRHMKDPGNLEAFHRLGSTRSNTTVLDSSMGTRTSISVVTDCYPGKDSSQLNLGCCTPFSAVILSRIVTTHMLSE